MVGNEEDEIRDAINRRRQKLVTGHMPEMWNHEPHNFDDYNDNRLRSEMNGLEVALWIIGGKVGKPTKWG